MIIFLYQICYTGIKYVIFSLVYFFIQRITPQSHFFPKMFYFQEARKDIYKHTFIKQIFNVKAGYATCQKSTYIINFRFVLF